MDLFELNGRVVVDLADALKAFDQIQKEGQQTESKVSKFFSGIGNAAVAVGKTVATGLAAAGAAMGALTVKALNLSGELEQNMGGSEAVFGEYASKMQDTAAEAFANMGLSTSDYLATANKMGALFQGSGFDIKESMELSSSAMQRAADVASIMGIDTSAAMEAIAGAAKGNFTMLDNLGVAMNETTLNAYAMEKGIGKTTQEMTNQEKIGLAMEMFMEKTAYATGNYAKENETLAGSLGTAKSALTNFLDGSGDVDSLVSAFSNAANVIVDSLDDILPRLTTGLTELVNKIVPLIPPLLQKLLPAIVQGATTLVNGVVAALPALLSAIMDILPALIQGFQQIINAIITALPQLMQSFVAALPTLIPMLVEALVSMIVTLCENFAQIIQPLIDSLPDIIISLVDTLMDNLPILIDGCIQLVLGIVEAIPKITAALVDSLPRIVSSIVTGLLNCLPQLISGATKMAKSWSESFSKTIENLKKVIPNIFKGVWNGIKNVFSGVGTWFKDVFTAAKNSIAAAFSNVGEKLSAPFTKARDIIKGIADKIKGFFKGEISLPKIKLPHFGISPSGWKIGDLLKGELPKLSIKWYAEAMNNPMLLTEPTIFGYNSATGQLQGGGEAGNEVVSGAGTLMNMIGNAVESKTNPLGERIISLLSALLNAIVGGNQEMLQALLAGQKIVIDEREFARTVKKYA